jgi:hypothetical protein
MKEIDISGLDGAACLFKCDETRTVAHIRHPGG